MTKKEQEQKIKEARRIYMTQWRKDNPEKIKAATDRYWLKKAEEMEVAK